MQVILLGTAAGGGFPQWNCWCPSCRIARREPARARPRSQSSAAVSADGPAADVHAQLARIPGPEPRGMRHVPIEGVVLTDAELDHTLGIVLLREGRFLQLYATPAAQSVIERDSSMLPVTRAFAEVRVEPLAIGGSTALGYRDGFSEAATAMGLVSAIGVLFVIWPLVSGRRSAARTTARAPKSRRRPLRRSKAAAPLTRPPPFRSFVT